MTTRAKQAQDAEAIQKITDGIAALDVETAIGALQSALAAHPDVTPEMLHNCGNFLSRYADQMERG